MRLSTRELATLAVFGALWGIVEISLGSLLKSLHIPLSGVVLAAIGLTIALIGRIFVPKPGSTLFIGIIATLLKLFSLGGVVLGPMVGILTEALVAEIVLTLFGTPRRISFVLAGGLGVAWVLFQPFVTGPLLFGRTVFVVWLDLLDLGGRLLGLGPNAALWIFFSLLAIYLAVGCFVGWLSWDIACLLRARRGKPLASGYVTSLAIGLLLASLLSGCASPAPTTAQEAPAQATAAQNAAPSLLVSGGDSQKTFTRASLEALPSAQAAFKDVQYKGVVLAALLQEAGFDPQSVKAVKAVASDGFTVNYDPSQFLRPDFLLAYARADGDLTADDGAFRIVLPDAEGKLNPRMLVELQVVQ